MYTKSIRGEPNNQVDMIRFELMHAWWDVTKNMSEKFIMLRLILMFHK